MQTGNFQLVREINRRLLFGLIRQVDQPSRSSLVEMTALSKATVSVVVDELIGRGLIVEGSTALSPVGRRPVPLRINEDGPALGAVKIGPHSVQGSLLSLNGGLLAQTEISNHPGQGQSAVRAVIEALQTIRSLARQARRQLLGAGISVPGILNPLSDVVLSAPSLNWRNVSLRRLLERAVPFPIWLGEEAKMAALAEAILGGEQGVESLLYLSLEATVGGGIVRHGEALAGMHVAHLSVWPEGPVCWCGNRGCLEAIIGTSGLRKRFAELGGEKRPPVKSLAAIDGSALVRMAGAGDAMAAKVLDETAEWVAIAAANLVNLYQPELILLGGWAEETNPAWLAKVRAGLRKRALPALIGPVRLDRARLGAAAALTGAALLALEGSLGD